MTNVLDSPYPGPRPFESRDRDTFFAREGEVADLTSLVIAHRVVLIYAQSGAGKTSLLNAGLIPSLIEEGFEVLPPVRVRGLVGEDLASVACNVFVLNTLKCWSDTADPRSLLGVSIPAFLKGRAHAVDSHGFGAPCCIVFDQFEELFAFYPERWAEREGFFRDVGQALREDPLLHALFVMREDYVANVDPYAHLLPGRFDTRYRLERLRPRAACEAAEAPLKGTTRSFAPNVAATLIDQLLAIRLESHTGSTVEVKGEFVEPVQLQIAVESLWNELPADVTVISQEHLRAFGDVNDALREFYATTLARTAQETGVSEDVLREWFDRHLITPAGTRGTVFRGPDTTEGVPNRAVDVLENRHLIRAEIRAGGRWYELTHDRFIRPIQVSNETWRKHALEAKMRSRREKAVAIALVALGVVALAGYAQRIEQRRVRSLELAANALLPTVDPEESVCLALAAAEMGGTSETARIESALRQALRASRVRKVFRSNDDPILATMFGPDGRWLVVTASKDNTARVWDADGKGAVALKSHTTEVGSAVLSPDGQWIATTTVDGTAHVARTSTGEPLFELKEAGYFLTEPQFSPDGTRLLAVSSDSTVRLWSVATRERLAVLRGHEEPVSAAAFSPDGVRVVTASADKTARIWDASSGAQLLELVGHRQPLTDARFAPDGKTVLTASEDATARLWDSARGSTLAELRGHAGRVESASFGPGGATIVTAGDDGTARTWLAETGAPIATLRGHEAGVKSAAFSADGRRVATASLDGTARMWDVSEGWLAALPRQAAVDRLSFSDDSKYVITTAADGTPQVFEARTGQLVSKSGGEAEAGALPGAKFSPDDQWLQSLSDNGPPSFLSATADGRSILAAMRTTAGVWDVATGKRLALLDGHTGWVTSASFAADGVRAATASTDQTVRVWALNTGATLAVLPHPDGVTEVAFPRGPDNRGSTGPIADFVLTTAPNGTVRVWDVGVERTIMQLPGPGGVIAAISPDGKLVATARDDGVVETYACETCAPLDELRSLAPTRVVTKACTNSK
jgi:WD40 repeat protein